MNMPKNVDEMQQLWKENMDAGMKSFDAMSKGFQAIAVEFANYSKRSLEDHTAATERLMAAKSLEKAFEVQSEYVKMAFEGFVAHATKIGELYADLAKELFKPIEGVIGRKPFAS
jgi:phasin family protein